MAQVTISFLGVCTIFRDLPSLVPPGTNGSISVPANRVVLARATETFRSFTGIAPHVAKLQFVADAVTFNGPPLPPADPPSAGVYSLDGVGLKILNAANTTLSEPRGLDCLPSLHTYLGGTIGAPAPWVYLPDRTNVQAWFDVPGGEWLAYLMNTNPPCPIVPSISVLTMETAGDPQLECWPWDGSPSTTVTLQGGSPNINVMNFANGSAFVEDNADFRLNYCLTVPFPPVQGISIPQANACRFRSPATYNVDGCGDAGPGCSNTTYP